MVKEGDWWRALPFTKRGTKHRDVTKSTHYTDDNSAVHVCQNYNRSAIRVPLCQWRSPTYNFGITA
jgi:hypothetical protein